MTIFVGSKNPVKVNSVINASSETWPDVQVIGIEVPSGIADQPMSDGETRKGATNRAKAVLEAGLKNVDSKEEVLGIGLEGGVFELQAGELWSTVWAVVVDKDGNQSQANGARFKVPKIVADKIYAGGEMGPIIAQIHKEDNVKQKQGMIGVITENFVDRTEEYTAIAKLALGLWYGKDWDNKITST